MYSKYSRVTPYCLWAIPEYSMIVQSFGRVLFWIAVVMIVLL
jgi:hypothetical protein